MPGLNTIQTTGLLGRRSQAPTYGASEDDCIRLHRKTDPGMSPPNDTMEGGNEGNQAEESAASLKRRLADWLRSGLEAESNGGGLDGGTRAALTAERAAAATADKALAAWHRKHDRLEQTLQDVEARAALEEAAASEAKAAAGVAAEAQAEAEGKFQSLQAEFLRQTQELERRAQDVEVEAMEQAKAAAVAQRARDLAKAEMEAFEEKLGETRSELWRMQAEMDTTDRSAEAAVMVEAAEAQVTQMRAELEKAHKAASEQVAAADARKAAAAQLASSQLAAARVANQRLEDTQSRLVDALGAQKRSEEAHASLEKMALELRVQLAQAASELQTEREAANAQSKRAERLSNELQEAAAAEKAGDMAATTSEAAEANKKKKNKNKKKNPVSSGSPPPKQPEEKVVEKPASPSPEASAVVSERARLESERAASEAVLAVLREAADAKRREVCEACTKRDSQVAHLETLRRETEEALEQQRSLEAHKEVVDADLMKLRAEVSSNAEKAADLKRQDEDADREVLRLQQVLRQKVDRIAELQKGIEEAEAHCGELEAVKELAEAKSQQRSRRAELPTPEPLVTVPEVNASEMRPRGGLHLRSPLRSPGVPTPGGSQGGSPRSRGLREGFLLPSAHRPRMQGSRPDSSRQSRAASPISRPQSTRQSRAGSPTGRESGRSALSSPRLKQASGDGVTKARLYLERAISVQGRDSKEAYAAMIDLALALEDESMGSREAGELFRRALYGFEKLLGLNDMETLRAANNLAVFLDNAGETDAEMSEAIRLYRRAVSGRKKELGGCHPYTLDSLYNLAACLWHQGYADEAEATFREVRQGCMKAFGAHHHGTIDCTERLVQLLEAQEQLGEAAKLCREVCSARESSQGLLHAATLDSLVLLANLLVQAEGEDGDESQEAEEAQREALRRHKEALGLGDIRTQELTYNLSIYFCDHERDAEAEELLRESLEEVSRHADYGSRSPVALCYMDDLAILLEQCGKVDEAEAFFRRAYDTRRVDLGAEHEDTLRSMNNLAVLLENEGQTDGALTLYRQVANGRGKVLGPAHPKTLESLYGFAVCLADRGEEADLEEAIPLLQDTLRRCESNEGRHGETVLTCAEKLGEVYKAKQQLSLAEAMFQRVYEAADAGNTDAHAAADAAYNLAVCLAQQGREEEAEPLYKTACEGYVSVLSPDDPNTLDAVFNLAACIEAQGRLQEAEILYKVVLEGRERTLPPGDVDLQIATAALNNCLAKEAADMSALSTSNILNPDPCSAGGNHGSAGGSVERQFHLHTSRISRPTPGSSRASLSRDE
eukprot:TRINITY_DN38874_c0_g1_i1.p1 TRINITY_DN38874_c0_g1~~TRINITY_DN38874_c0_g1_i1.p1  ORF type:complete len:1298 (-),score=376.45 TRINITY_DN38874_c0_g1_i1:141-4034(-)